MSRYPNNPYWHHASDRPISIDSQEKWDRAAADGDLTAEHVLNRLEAILEFEFGNGAEMGYDENGFLISLVSVGLTVEGGVKFYVYPNDHPPPHTHIVLKADPAFEMRLRLDNAEPMDEHVPDGWAKKIKRWQTLVLKHNSVLMEWWIGYHGPATT